MQRAPEIGPGAKGRLLRLVLPPAWVLLLLATLAFAAGLDVPPTLLYVPFAASLVFLGLPHGAVDHLVPGWLSSRGPAARSVLGVALLYAALGSLVVALWFATPALAFALFVLLTWFHWGTGDLYALESLAGAGHVEGPVARAMTVLVRGGLPVLVPLLAFPETYRAVAGAALGLFGEGLTWQWVFAAPFRVSAGAAFSALTILSLALGHRHADREHRRGWWLDAGETALLAAFFCAVPPVLAVGLYFCLWHSARHVARLILLDPTARESLERGRTLRAFAAFARAAAPLTVAALVLLAGLYSVIPSPPGQPVTLLALYLVLLSALTLPHAIVVAYADVRQGNARRAVKDGSVAGT